MVRLVETIAEEVRDHNVQINCMSPGGTYTHMTDEILRAGDKVGWKETEDALEIRRTGGVAPGKTNPARPVPGLRTIQPHQREIDSRQ